MNATLRVAAIYTTFRPDEKFSERIKHIVASCFTTIVVDNTPGGHAFRHSEIPGVTLLQDGVNKGLGPALNAGIAEAVRQNCDAVVLFDQDSSPDSEFITRLFNGLVAVGSRTVLGPLLFDDKINLSMSGISNLSSNEVEFVTCLPTSGMCFKLDESSIKTSFTDDFFLDLVDFEWCWRMRQQGWRVCRLNSLLMPHRLGLAQRRFAGVVYHVPEPYRHYFQFRDALKLIFLKHVPLYSRFRFVSFLFPKLIIYPFLMDYGFERFIWMLKGIIDAFLGVKGVGAAASKLRK